MKDWGPWLTTGFWDALFLFKQLLGISGIRDDTSSSDLLESITLRWFPRLFFDPRCAIPHHVSTIQKSLTAILEHVHHKYTALRQVDGVGIVKIRQVGRATQHRTTWLISAYLVYTAYIYIQNVAKSSICIWCVCLLIYIYTLYIYIISVVVPTKMRKVLPAFGIVSIEMFPRPEAQSLVALANMGIAMWL